MVSIIVWIQIALKFEFKFRTKQSLDVWVSDASNPPMVGYLLEVLLDRSPFRAAMQIKRLPFTGSL
jgi:hypothetical protein